MYLIQVIRFVSELWQVSDFLLFPPQMTAMIYIDEKIYLKVELNTHKKQKRKKEGEKIIKTPITESKIDFYHTAVYIRSIVGHFCPTI